MHPAGILTNTKSAGDLLPAAAIVQGERDLRLAFANMQIVHQPSHNIIVRAIKRPVRASSTNTQLYGRRWETIGDNAK